MKTLHHLSLLSILTLLLIAVADAQTPKPEPGLVVRYKVGGANDLGVVPNVSVRVNAGEPVSPFVASGAFTAEWSGFISVDLRGDYAFSAELNGALKLELNTTNVIEFDATKSEPSKAIRLSKGTNAFKLSYTAPASGDAFLRLRWIPKGSIPQPIPDSAFSHAAGSDEVKQALLVAKGRGLVFEHRCTKCHVAGDPAKGSPELAYDAPTFEGIGSRRGQAWLTKWISDPKASRATARMPKMVHGANAATDAADIAAFLVTQTATDAAPADTASGAALIETGKTLAEKLHCAGCHTLPGSEPDPKKPTLKHVKNKFPGGHLAAFLKQPDKHYAWSRMPNFQLKDAEAQAVAAWLNSNADAPGTAAAGNAEHGKQLVQSTGCLNCHALKLENQFKAKPLTELAAANWSKGCVADKEEGATPFFGFDADQRAALAAFAGTDRASLTRHVPAEFAARQTVVLQCGNCHGQLEGFPRLEILGGKLRPEWTAQFIAGKVKYKPRPWIETRMPYFPARAEMLAAGLAALHGLPPKTPAEPAPDAEETKIGLKLVSADGGFSCIACHAVGSFGATQVFESAGVNLAYSSERLQRSYFDRWLVKPTGIEPQTKMPEFFQDYPNSPLADIHGGDAKKQVNAIWQYLQLGSKMPPPGPVTQ